MKLARKKGIPNKRNKTRQIKLIPSNSINFSISSSHAWEKSFLLYQSRALPIFPIFPILYLLWLIILSPRHFISFLSVFHYPSYLRSFEILDPPFNLAPASRFLKHTRDSIPFFLSPFLPRYYRLPLSLSFLKPSTFNPCRDPSFPPSRQPFSALYNFLKDSVPSRRPAHFSSSVYILRFSLGAPFPLRISNTTSNVS